MSAAADKWFLLNDNYDKRNPSQLVFINLTSMVNV